MQIKRPALEAQNRKTIECYLKTYHLIQAEIEDIEKAIAESNLTVQFSDIHSRSINSQTERKAIKMSEYTKLNTLRGIVKAIEVVSEELKASSNETPYKVMVEYCMTNRTYQEASLFLSVDRSLLYKYQNMIIDKIGDELGLPV